MLVKVKPGHAVYREHYYRTPDDGVFRLYQSPPADGDEPSREPQIVRPASIAPDGSTVPALLEDPRTIPTKFEKWLGMALEPATEFEIARFEASEENIPFDETISAEHTEEAFGRAGRIAMAAAQLDHGNDSHWTKEGEPSHLAIQEVSGLVNVQASEVRATVPELRRLDPAKMGAGGKKFTEKG